MIKPQTKTRQRVSEHGEVFTAEREVTAMLDLVKQETERIESRFLEPACGDGNFLAEVTKRKLSIVKKLYKRSTYDYERFSVLAICSIYGIDILNDNVIECRERIFEIWNKEYTAVCRKESNEDTRDTIKYILSKNILCGNALTLMRVDNEQHDTQEPIIFPEWSPVSSNLLKRRDFRLDVLLKANDKPQKDDGQELTNGYQDVIYKYLSINPVTGEYMPKPINEFSPIQYRRIKENG